MKSLSNKVEIVIQSVSRSIFKMWNVKVDCLGMLKITPSNNIKVGFFLFPELNEIENFQNSTLEDLCLKLLSDADVFNFSDVFNPHIQFKEYPI